MGHREYVRAREQGHDRQEAQRIAGVRDPLPPWREPTPVAPSDGRCHCPDDCGCRKPWRENVCGCRRHDPPTADCPMCDGTGQHDGIDCHHCGGGGLVY